MKTKRLVERLTAVLDEAVAHQVSNRGTRSSFYNCYTYRPGKFPDWVKKAERLLKIGRGEGKKED